ncbi:MAG TPA: cellulase family glycosylhydrolase [Thermomicrobiales bacterium]|nr:cellulase family glycosylhydrolase [Thermomicrobiales bacterium]
MRSVRGRRPCGRPGLSALLLVALALSACGGAKPTATAPPPTATTAAAASSPTTAATATATPRAAAGASPAGTPGTPATPAGAATPGAPLKAGHVEYGFNVFLGGNAESADLNSTTMAKVHEAGFGWVRVQLQWSEIEPSPGKYATAPYDTIIAAASQGGTKVLVSVVKSPDWASPSRHGALPEDTAAFGRTMGYLAARYKGRVQAWEIWNEENLAGEVGGKVQIAPYFDTLKAAYGAVKAADPTAFVLFGGLTPTGVNDPSVAVDDTVYLREFYQYQNGAGRAYFDALAAHPGSAANPPDTKYPENPGSGECPQIAIDRNNAKPGTCWRDAPDFYFRRVEDERAVMAQAGDADKQIWLTEFGWDSCQGLPAPKGYEYCLLTSEQQQAQYLTQAFQIAKTQWPWMGVMFIWNLNYAATPYIKTDDEKYGWSLLVTDWRERPAYQAMKALPK